MKWACAAVGLFVASCHRAPVPRVADAGAAEALPVVRVLPKGHYVFSWYGADGKVHDADALSAIPEAARKQVIVRDLSRSAESLQSDRYLYLADLSGAAPDDGWPTSVVSRYEFEAQDDSQLPALAPEAQLDGGRPLVIVYGTSWCGACRAAREHFRQLHVPFADKDIEKDPAAAAELERKAKRAGLRLGGVPVLDIGGQLLVGFDAATVDHLLAQAAKG